MDCEKTKETISEAIGIVGSRLLREAGDNGLDVGWCELREVAFDEEDTAMVRYRWRDVMNHGMHPNGEDGGILVEEDDLICPAFVAGMIYADILRRERLLER